MSRDRTRRRWKPDDAELCTGTERRAFPRHPARESRAWLGCWVEDGFEVDAVMVLNISRGGLALEMEYQPEIEQSVWLRLHGDADTPTMQATVVGVEPGLLGRFRTRLKFPRPCPDNFYSAVIRGIRVDEQAEGRTSPGSLHRPHGAVSDVVQRI